MPAPEPRCDLTELMQRDCAHCRQIPDPPLRDRTDEERLTLIRTGRWLPALYTGVCVGCGDRFTAGTAIRRGVDGWIGECCADEDEEDS